MANENVTLKTMTLAQISGMNLNIPEYQRDYCWDQKNVIQLLQDIENAHGATYRLGSLILCETQPDHFDIVDGQQRLITLTLVLNAIDSKNTGNLLNLNFTSETARQYIAYNYKLIRGYLESHDFIKRVPDLARAIEFSVLKINCIAENGADELAWKNMDLAFTFFSNTNSRGVRLSDFDLLKAHHLRYLPIAGQQVHMAQRWNAMVLDADSKHPSWDRDNRDYIRTLEIYIYCLRKWLRKRPVNEWEAYRVKNEYESAAIIDEIPPFGEAFQYKEPIQGGSHFFAYTEHFVNRFKNFTTTEEYKAIHQLRCESHVWFRDVIEANLFAYYLKFGEQYLTEALLLIARLISEIRYREQRVYREKLLNSNIGSLELSIAIDQATSPTFFLAEILSRIKHLPKTESHTGIRARYKARIEDCLRPLLGRITTTQILPYIRF